MEFPAIGQQPYRLTLAPYGFLWLELHPKPEAVAVGVDLMEHSPLSFADDWKGVLQGTEGRTSTCFLTEYIPAQRWFAAKSRQIKSTRILDWAPLEPSKSV